MKRFLCMILALVMALSLVACGDKDAGIAMEDETTGVAMTAAKDVFPNGTELTVSYVSNSSDTGAIVKASLDGISGRFVIFDMGALNGTEKVQPDGKVDITIPIPSGYSKNLAVYYVADDGTNEKIDTTVNEEDLTVTASLQHFSTYVLADLDVKHTTDEGGNDSATAVQVEIEAAKDAYYQKTGKSNKEAYTQEEMEELQSNNSSSESTDTTNDSAQTTSSSSQKETASASSSETASSSSNSTKSSDSTSSSSSKSSGNSSSSSDSSSSKSSGSSDSSSGGSSSDSSQGTWVYSEKYTQWMYDVYGDGSLGVDYYEDTYNKFVSLAEQAMNGSITASEFKAKITAIKFVVPGWDEAGEHYHYVEASYFTTTVKICSTAAEFYDETVPAVATYGVLRNFVYYKAYVNDTTSQVYVKCAMAGYTEP